MLYRCDSCDSMGNFASKERIVIKVGTSTLTYPGGSLNLRRVSALVRVLSDIRNSGRQVILVSSGAVGLGASRAGLTSKPAETRRKQACAAIGQCELMQYYGREFGLYNHTVAQLLLTRTAFTNAERRENTANTLATLLEMGIIPVINANDVVSLKYLDFDENDTLAAYVAQLGCADMLVLLTDVDGLYDRDPADPDAVFVGNVPEITPEIIAAAGGAGSALASGGMIAKIEAAAIALESGIVTAVASGETPDILYDVIDGTARCTYFGV